MLMMMMIASRGQKIWQPVVIKTPSLYKLAPEKQFLPVVFAR